MRARVREKNRELGAYVLRSADDFPENFPPKICHLGTPQIEESLYWELEHAGHNVVIIPARYPDEEMEDLYGDRLAEILRDDLRKDPDLRGKPTEPARFSDRELLKRERKAGPHGWMLQFMLSPTLGESNRFPLKLPDLIVTDCDDREAPEKQWWSSVNLVLDLPCPGLAGQDWHGPNAVHEGKMMPYTECILAVDPSTGGTDELGYVVLKLLNSQLHLLDCGGFVKGDSDATMKRLALVAKRFKPHKVIVEKNFGMGMWGKLFAPFLRKEHSCEIEGVHVTGKKQPRICSTLEPVIASHRLIVSKAAIESDIRSSHVHEADAVEHQLFYQMAHITRDPDCLKKDDRIDALSLGVAHFEEALDLDFYEEMQEREADELDQQLEDWSERALFQGSNAEPSHNWIN
jgi:hypothetical protein